MHTSIPTRSRLRADRLLPFNYSVIFKKSRRRTACSSRASYGTIPLEILLLLLLLLLLLFFLLLLLLLRFSRIQWTMVQVLDTTPGCHLSRVREGGERDGRRTKRKWGETVIAEKRRDGVRRSIERMHSKLITAINAVKILSLD